MVDFKAMLEKQKAEKANLKEQIDKAKEGSTKSGGFVLGGGAVKKPIFASTIIEKKEEQITAGGVQTAGGAQLAHAGVEIEKTEKTFGQNEKQPENMPSDVQQEFEQSLLMVVEGLENRELLGQAVQHTMMFLQEHPALCEILAPENIQILVRGLRESYGVQVANKTEKQEKKAKKNEELNGLMDQLGKLMGRT